MMKSNVMDIEVIIAHLTDKADLAVLRDGCCDADIWKPKPIFTNNKEPTDA